LRNTKIPGLETGMRHPKDMTLLMRVLELRQFKEEDDAMSFPMNGSSHNSLTEMTEESGPMVTNEMLENARQAEATEIKRTRVRSEGHPWHWVIKELVKEGVLPKKITPQALKKMLKNRYPEWPWDKT
jgi:hypothetical protein